MDGGKVFQDSHTTLGIKADQLIGRAMNKKCKHCTDGYKTENGLCLPCKYCITPARFEKTLETAIANCGKDAIKRKTLIRIKNNLPDYPVMALLEAEGYAKFSSEFIFMLKEAYEIRSFMDVTYKKTE